jgi:hypothetical protein
MAMLHTNAIICPPAAPGIGLQDGFWPALARPARLPEGKAAGWKEWAVETYKHGRPEVERALRVELASRLSVLTGRQVSPDVVYADPDRRAARVTVDGTSFRLTGGRLVLLSPCEYCGVREYESPTIETPLDLGYVLSLWKPYCRDCTPEDAEEWE